MAGATTAFAHDQSVTPDAATTALRSTTGADAITGSGGLDPGQSVRVGAGGDTIALAGQVSGTIDGGDGPLSAAFRSATVAADLHLDATTSGENDNAYLNVHDDAVSGVSGTLRVHVDSDSALQFLDTSTTTVTIDGLGKLSARLTQNGQGLPPPTLTVDAFASAGMDLGYSAVSPNARFALSASSNTLTLALPQPGILMATLGAGADTLTVSSLANLNIANDTSVSGLPR